MGRGWWWLAAVPAAAMSCVELDDLSSAGAPDGGPEDAATTFVEAGSDVVAEADAGTFCQRRAFPKPDLCRDFDDNQPVDSLWDGRNPPLSVDAGVTRIDTDRPFSTPGSLLVAVPPFDGGTFRELSLNRGFTPVVSGIHIEFSYRLNAGRGRILQLGFSRENRAIFFEIGENSAVFADVPSYQFFNFILNRPVLGAWSRIVIDLSYATRELKVTVDGQDPFKSPAQLAPIDTPTGTFDLSLGFPAAFDMAGSSLNLDDVLVLLK